MNNELNVPFFDPNHFGHIGQGIMASIDGIEQLYQRRGAINGLATSFKGFDHLSNGLEGGLMYVLAGRPSMGKTELAMNIVAHVAIGLEKPVAVFTLEMTRTKLAQRMLCSLARVNLLRGRDGFLMERDLPSITNAASKLADAAIQIEDNPGSVDH